MSQPQRTIAPARPRQAAYGQSPYTRPAVPGCSLFPIPCQSTGIPPSDPPYAYRVRRGGVILCGARTASTAPADVAATCRREPAAPGAPYFPWA